MNLTQDESVWYVLFKVVMKIQVTMEGGKFVDQLREYKLLKDCVSCTTVH